MDHKEINEETNNPEIKKINDIFSGDEIKDVDISSVFVLSKVKVFKELFKQSTKDLSNKLKKSVFLSIFPKIKILKLHRPFNNEIRKNKKNKPINLNNYNPQKDKTTLNLINIEEINKSSWPYFDLKIDKKSKFNFNFSPKFNFKLNLSFIKIWIYFILFILTVFIYWFSTKFYIEKTFSNLKNINLQDISNIEWNLKDLKTDLIISNVLIKPLLVLNFFVWNSWIENLWNIVPATNKILDFWISIFEIYNWVNKIIIEKWVDQVMFSQLLENIKPIILDMQKNLNISLSTYNKVWSFNDKNLDIQFQKYKNKLNDFNNYFNLFVSNFDNVKNILWHEEKRTYMIIFQNNDEIRPTWWFMWSVGFIEIFRWKILNFEKKDIYAVEWDLKNFWEKNWVAFIKPAPEWLKEISKTFWLRDANYYPSIKESSEEIKGFLEKSDKYKIDWIVYINQNIIINILKKTWPIYFEKYKKEITSENFSSFFSTLVEAKITKTDTLSTPKQVLFDFMEVFFSELKSNKDYSLYLKLAFESLEKKDILFYLFDEKENNLLKEIWLYKEYNFEKYIDFNYPVFTSISWNKSDRYIKRSFSKNYTIKEDCSIDTTFNIKQKHNFNINEEINIKTILYDMDLLWKVDVNNLLQIQWKWLNRQYIRVLIPKNSIINNNSKLKIKEFENYKEVSFFLNTNSLFESNFSFDYNILNPECKNYNYIFIKQPWINNYDLNLTKSWILEQNIYSEKDFIFNY